MLIQIGTKIANFIYIIRLLFIKHYFGFVQGHSYFTKEKVASIKEIFSKSGLESDNLIVEFELKFANLLGDGNCISFASARMAFYSLLKELKIGSGDEVILQAANCSVMVNAILRIGATPIFVDIDPETFGSSEKAIRNRITDKTKMIVAQHSFGIPCKINEISQLAKNHSIFLLEDCALSLGSAISGVTVGNWGNAALFSTDHSKPINTYIGGVLYTKDNGLHERVKLLRNALPDLSIEHQKSLFKQFLFERKYFSPNKYGFGCIISYFKVVLKKLNLIKWENPSLLDDCIVPNKIINANYPYPAKLPPFLAKIGIYELERWNKEKNARVELFKKYLDICIEYEYAQYLPKAYFDKSLQIVPLRFVFNHPDAIHLRKKASKYLDVDGFWFLKPIVACENPSDFGYVYGSCHVAERFGEEVINFPCVLDHFYDSTFLKYLKSTINPS